MESNISKDQDERNKIARRQAPIQNKNGANAGSGKGPSLGWRRKRGKCTECPYSTLRGGPQRTRNALVQRGRTAVETSRKQRRCSVQTASTQAPTADAKLGAPEETHPTSKGPNHKAAPPSMRRSTETTSPMRDDGSKLPTAKRPKPSLSRIYPSPIFFERKKDGDFLSLNPISPKTKDQLGNWKSDGFKSSQTCSPLNPLSPTTHKPQKRLRSDAAAALTRTATALSKKGKAPYGGAPLRNSYCILMPNASKGGGKSTLVKMRNGRGGTPAQLQGPLLFLSFPSSPLG